MATTITTTTATPPPTLDFCGVLSESKKIMKSHSRHFLALSVLFLLPLSFSLSVYPTIQNSLLDPSTTQQSRTLLRHHSPFSNSPTDYNLKPLIFTLLYAFFVLCLSLSATATISYSVYHGFYGRPVKLISALKSLSNSFPRLLITFLCSQLIILSISVIYAIIVFFTIKGIEYLGFHVVDSLNFFTIIQAVTFVVLGFVLVYLQVNWALAGVVVVVESSWGLEPLRRSAYLVKGMRGVVVFLLLFFSLMTWLIIWATWESGVEVEEGVLRALLFVMKTVLCSAVVMLFLLQSVAANSVLYMYCKAFHGELAGEIAQEFAREYVSLPFDEEKVPFVVSVVHP